MANDDPQRVPVDLAEKLRAATVVVAVAGMSARVTFRDHAKVSLRTKDTAPAKLRYRDIAAQFERRYEAERMRGWTNAQAGERT